MIPPTRLTLTAHIGTLSTVSRFTGQGDFSPTDAQYWSGRAVWQDLLQSEKQALVGELLHARSFRLGPYASAIGPAAGAPALDGEQVGEEVATVGWDPDQTQALAEGDYVGIGERIHVALAAASSDSQGRATLALWPPVEAEPDAPLVLGPSATGSWYIEGDIDEQINNQRYTITATLIEAR